MGRRTPGDGSLFYDKQRKAWTAVVDLGRDLDTRKRVRRKISDKDKGQARAKLRRLLDEKAQTGTVARQDVTVERIVRDLLASPPSSWRSPITIQVNTGLADRIVKELGSGKVVKLTPGDVERFLGRMVTGGYSTSTISAAKGILGRAIRRAQRDGLVARNVAELADTPRGKRRESRSMDLDQIRKLFASDLSAWWRAYIMVGILCGLRPGELLGLTWDDIDFANGLIRVRHCLKAVPTPAGRVLQLADLKTQRSRRTLALPGKAAEALKALKAVQAAEKLKLGRHYSDQHIVFAGNAGQPKWRRDGSKGFRQVCERAGIGSDWIPYEQRHSFVSVLSDSGVDIEAIADAVGHLNSTITQTVYRHQIADKVTRAATAMDQIFGTGSGA